jgi:hypothetical protein
MQILQLAYSIITCLVIPECTVTTKDPVVFAIFAGTTPCSNVIRPLHKIREEPDCNMAECLCIMVEWKLTLYQDPVTGELTAYKLSSINRFIVKETNLYSQPGTKAESEGKCTIVRGSKTNPSAILYRLNPDKPAITIDFLKLSDHLLHIVDHDGKLMIGDEFWSYTLNRVPN